MGPVPCCLRQSSGVGPVPCYLRQRPKKGPGMCESNFSANERVWKQEVDKAKHLTRALVFWAVFQSGSPSSNLGEPTYVIDKPHWTGVLRNFCLTLSVIIYPYSTYVRPLSEGWTMDLYSENPVRACVCAGEALCHMSHSQRAPTKTTPQKDG